ncbi:hypothetical protein NKG05_11330 [Oerskovia sp. M15]
MAHQIDPVGLAGAPWVTYYARALGARIGPDVDLHALPPVTGMLEIASGAAIEPEVDLSGYWIDGDTVRIGGIRIGAGATIGARSTLAPGARIGRDAEIAPVRPCSAGCAQVSAGLGHPPRASAAPRALWRRIAHLRRGGGCGRTSPRRPCSGCCRSSRSSSVVSWWRRASAGPVRSPPQFRARSRGSCPPYSSPA